MNYIVLARKYRPATFEEVVGQATVARTLRNAIKMDRIPHACIFSGPRGVGKTTMARIFAKALDCEKGPTAEPCNKCDICEGISSGDDVDVVEIDGASNNKVEDIRDLRENAQFAASRARFKVYIIDEVHMLSRSAFNALLKTLEEPPPHVKFVFATTELNRIPDTVQSRCQRFDFVPLKTKHIVERLTMICGKEKAKAEDGVLERIAEHAEGSMRDAESVLDQVISLGGGELAMEDVNAVLGTASDEAVLEAARAALEGEAGKMLSSINDMVEAGSDPQMIAAQLAVFFRDLAVMKTCGTQSELVQRVNSIREPMALLADGYSEESLIYSARLLCDAERKMARNPNPSIILEMVLLKLKDAPDIESLGNLIKRFESDPDTSVPVSITEPPVQKKTVSEKDSTERKRISKRAPAGTDTTIVRSSWTAVIDRLKEKKQGTAALLREAQPLRFEDGKLIIGVSSGYKFHKEHLEEFENRELVEDSVEDVLGVRYEVQFISHGEEPSESSEVTATAAPKPVKKPRLREDPAVRKAAEIFNATVVSVKESGRGSGGSDKKS